MQNEVIFLDAVGTLFGVRGSVGQVYAEIAHRYGVSCDPQALDRAFDCAFEGAEPLAFPNLPVEEIPSAEYGWWQEVALRTFAKTEDLAKFRDFASFFRELYSHFATPEPWYLYSDTLPALESWRQQGITLGIISNFDSRLYQVLRALHIADYFSSITISTEAGTAKPDHQIFAYARGKHPQAERIVYIGDSYGTDIVGAINSGMPALWLNRNPKAGETRPYITKLSDLCQ